MKTLADFKRELIIGRKVRVTNFGMRVIHGNLGTRTLALKPWQTEVFWWNGKPVVQWEAEVASVSSSKVGFLIKGKPQETPVSLSWLDFPRAKEFKVNDGKAEIYWEDGKHILTYEFLPNQ